MGTEGQEETGSKERRFQVFDLDVSVILHQ